MVNHAQGILPAQHIRQLISSGAIMSANDYDPDQVQPASLDLRLGHTAYRLRASFLPGAQKTVDDCLQGDQQDRVLHKIDLSEGAVLETGCVYLVPLMESLRLPKNLSAAANPKSSTGRLDVFTRVISDNAQTFDIIPAGYDGPLYVEIAPLTFPVLVTPGERLVQIRFRSGEANILRSERVSIDLTGFTDDGIVGYRARRHSGLVTLTRRDHDPKAFWEPIYTSPKGLILDPNEFYILASKESVQIPENEAAEMAPVALEIGEFRAHYAGFFDPGFGMESVGGKGSRAVLEVRGRDVPFILEDGQPVARLLFEHMIETPDSLYGQTGSHYQAQSLRLSKHFRV